MSTAYEECLVPVVFGPYAEDLAARVAAHRPGRVLELAAGTGAVTAALSLALPDTVITATDLNDAMVAVGSRNVRGATWQQADAMSLPFDDDSFDLVACQFGVMFFPDRREAYAEVRRVLADDGHFLFNAWGRLEDHEFESAVTAVLAELFPDDPPTFLRSVPHGYADPDRITADLAAAGLEADLVELVELEGTAASAEQLARGYCRGTPLRAQIESRGDLDATFAAVAERLAAQFGDGAVTGRMTAHVVDAHPTRA
ncbi:MAG: class I SAM-dependent methyltransferase [Frankiaceae bacterium]|nr:class I SAM-dependent methyltransferase [Frankiaceae bacterium]MBV9872509.1 class I SAM-dependent methyltransferase [Frankiaceae bacterium]